MLCRCLSLWESTNNGYSHLLFIYQITPDSFTIDKSEKYCFAAWWCHTSTWSEGTSEHEKIPSRQSTWNGWHNSWLHGIRRSPQSETIERKFINASGDVGDRKIKLTVFIMWLCSIRGHLPKGHVWGKGKNLLRLPSSIAPTIHRLSYWFSFSFLRP